MNQTFGDEKIEISIEKRLLSECWTYNVTTGSHIPIDRVTEDQHFAKVIKKFFLSF